MTCADACCSDCQGNYPEIASAFIRVPNNFNSVNNSIDKFTLYKTLSVVEKATEHVECTGRKCAETGSKDHVDFRARDGKVDDFGFVAFPLRIRTDFVQVCGKVQCAKKGYTHHLKCDCCDDRDLDCADAVLGYISWPRHELVQDVRACNAIKSNLACKRRNRGPDGSSSCNVLLDCDTSSSSSSSSSRQGRARHSKSSRQHGRRRHGCGC
jgi:hypothetical protein